MNGPKRESYYNVQVASTVGLKGELQHLSATMVCPYTKSKYLLHEFWLEKTEDFTKSTKREGTNKEIKSLLVCKKKQQTLSLLNTCQNGVCWTLSHI